MKLALGIPVFNQVDTIVETVNSALSQTEPFDQIVVVDNHSTDGTSEKLAVFQDRITVVSPPEHYGISENWNFCTTQLKCSWFSLLSGDDILKPTFVSEIKRAIASNPDAVIIRTDWEIIDGTGKLTSTHNQLSVAVRTLPPKTWQEQLYGPKVSFAAFAARYSTYKEVGGFPMDFHLFHDWALWLKLAVHGPFIRIPKALAQYRIQARPQIDTGRVVPRVLDEYHYVMDILPRLPWTGSATLKIRKVRRRKLIDLLNFLTKYPEISKKEEVAARLSDWAHSADLAATYIKWTQSHSPIAQSVLFTLRNHAFRTLRSLYKLTRGR